MYVQYYCTVVLLYSILNTVVLYSIDTLYCTVVLYMYSNTVQHLYHYLYYCTVCKGIQSTQHNSIQYNMHSSIVLY